MGLLPIAGGLRDPVSSLTHLAAAALAVPVTLVLWRLCRGDRPKQVGMAVFGVSMILLYATSGTYHMISWGDRRRGFFRCLDHSMIFVLIAGSYTPFCLIVLNGPWGVGLLMVVWSVAPVWLKPLW